MPPTTRASKRRAIEGPLAAPEPSHIATGGAYAEPRTRYPDTPESGVEPAPKPTRKRTRRTQKKEKTGSASTQKSKRAKVIGKLEVFENVPVEVFIQIAKYLHPTDLVFLSRVNKFFRELFMSRQAASIWTSARLSVPGLPPCPLELCEPQYAAMIFTKMCSQCGKYAPRRMDSRLLVRLCTSCREEQFELISTYKITDWSLIALSNESDARHNRSLILRSDVEVVESKLKELSAAKDKGNLRRWRQERAKALQDKYANAKILEAWFEARDRARAKEIHRQKDAHEADITARLIRLGWKREDHRPSCDNQRKHWLSLVRVAKVLTDRAWNKLLPQLLGYLEANKRYRLAKERDARRADCQDQLFQFWYETKKKLLPLLQAIPQMDDTEAALLPVIVNEDNKLDQPFPSLRGIREWPEYPLLLNEDITGDEFKIKLLGKQDSFDEFAQKWRDHLEEQLIQHLPDHIQLPNFNAAGLSLTSNTQPVDSLSEGTQMLLRADVTFKKYEYHSYHSCCFYPDDFQGLDDLSLKQTKYDSDSSAIATDLLRTLGRPGATYLEMKALGRVFQCGRCSQGILVHWESLVKHYVAKKSEWERLSEKLAVAPSNEFPFIFTHDTNIAAEGPNKPLVRIVKQSEAPAPPVYTRDKVCLVCQAVGFYKSLPGTCITGHLRDVHLIEEPELGKHYAD